MTDANAGFGLYVHWPFCQAKCPYCDFNSHVVSRIDQAAWARSYVAEIDRLSAQTPHLTLQTIYFGGGTPSLMAPATVETIIEAARRAWPMVNAPEITLEANPSSVELGRFRAYRSAGVSRVSVGVQALNDTDLKRLGRLHSAKEALLAFEAAFDVFDAATFDLIYARQDQTADDWARELTQALALGPDHLSLYQLTIESETAFGDRAARGRLPGLPDDDAGAEMYEITQELCAAAGLPAYEISNHARPGAESRHNLIYWRSGDWVGIGPGAHGRLGGIDDRVATEAEPLPGKWLASVAEGRSDHESRTPVDQADQATDYLMMGLRLSEGVSLRRLHDMGVAIPLRPALDRLSELGLVDVTEDRLRATEAGRPLLNAILRELLPG